MASNVARLIKVDCLQFADNVRTPECMSIPAIVESFRLNGFKPNHPLVVSEKPGKDGSTYLVLCGNRRGLGLRWLQGNEPETYQRVVPNGTVPAIVHKGLTREEEVDLRIDHSPAEDRVPLDEWSTFLAIQQLVRGGIDTQDRIATKLGLFKTTGKKAGQPRREWVQVRVNLARLPEFVQAEFRKLTLDKDSTPVRWANVANLYKTYNEEYLTHPDGQGPEFQELWRKLTTPPEPIVEGDTSERPDPKELSPADAIKRSQAASSQGLRQALLVVTRQSPKDLSEIDAHLVAAESALQITQDMRAYLGDADYASLVDAATKQGNERRELEKERVESEASAEGEDSDSEADKEVCAA